MGAALVAVVGLLAATTTTGAERPTQGNVGAATTTVAAPAAPPSTDSTTTSEAPKPEALQSSALVDDGITVAEPPALPVRVVTGVCTTDEAYCHPPTTPPRTPWRWCEQWHDMAAEVGWPEDQGPVLSYVMHRESNCQPGAYNRSGATGLLQLLGWSCPPGGCRDPWSNLAKGLELWQGQGWCPWVLRGDPVTGRACG
jgi:hypothetical protein